MRMKNLNVDSKKPAKFIGRLLIINTMSMPYLKKLTA